jgi:plastocyanin
VLIDPDGYVFNSTLGFDLQNPTQHVIPGARVTCMAFLPGWGGWVPWPAHLYENQINPQVVGSNGYFAFFVPPGQYYLQVEPPAGFQAWRSPVVTVVNEIVHVNVPLTPIPTGSIYTLQTSLFGFSQSNLVVPPGSVVQWLAVQGAQEEMSDLISAETDPVLQLISSPDPFASTSGWDSGRLIPGESYQYRFDIPGTYTYTDSAGHTAIIRVGVENKIFLPLVNR